MKKLSRSNLAKVGIYFLLTAFSLFLLEEKAECAVNVARDMIIQMHNEVIVSTGPWMTNSINIARYFAFLLAAIGFVLSLKDVAVSGNLGMDTIVATALRYLMIIGLIAWLLQGDALNIRVIPRSIALIGGRITGAGPVTLQTLIDNQIEILRPMNDFMATLTGITNMGLYIVCSIGIFMLNVLFFMMAATIFCINMEVIFIQTAGLFTIGFLYIPFFRDMFLGYLKGLAIASLKLTLLTMLMGMMNGILVGWIGTAAAVGAEGTHAIPFLMNLVAASVVFYMLMNSVPAFASAILTGSPTGMGGGALTGAAMAGGALAMTTYGMVRSGATATAKKVSDAARGYQQGSQSVRDAGGSSGQARVAGAKEALFGALGVTRSKTDTGSGASPIGQNTITFAGGQSGSQSQAQAGSRATGQQSGGQAQSGSMSTGQQSVNQTQAGSGTKGQQSGSGSQPASVTSPTARSSPASSPFSGVPDSSHSTPESISARMLNQDAAQTAFPDEQNRNIGASVMNAARDIFGSGFDFGAGAVSSPQAQESFWNGLGMETRIKIAQSYGIGRSGTLQDADNFWRGLSPTVRDRIYKKYK